MINWLTNVALDEHLKRSGNDALKQAAKKENVIIMYPQHYSKLTGIGRKLIKYYS